MLRPEALQSITLTVLPDGLVADKNVRFGLFSFPGDTKATFLSASRQPLKNVSTYGALRLALSCVARPRCSNNRAALCRCCGGCLSVRNFLARKRDVRRLPPYHLRLNQRGRPISTAETMVAPTKVQGWHAVPACPPPLAVRYRYQRTRLLPRQRWRKILGNTS